MGDDCLLYLNYLFPDEQIDLFDNNDRTTQLDARVEDDDSIDDNFIEEILAEDRIINRDPNEAPGPMEVVGDYLVPQPETQTFSNIPVCVLTNNQNNTDGDIHVIQDPADRLVAQKDIFSEGPIVETVAHYQSHGSTSNEDPDNLKDLEAKISLIKETSPQSITSDLTPDHAHLPQSQTSSAPTPPSNCVSVIRSNTQAQTGKIQRASVSHRETPYTVPSQFQCDQCDFSSPSQHGLKIHTGKAHKLHTVSLPCTTSVVYNLIPVNASNDGVITYVPQPQPSSTLPSQNAPAFSAPATSIIPNLTAAPEAEKKETA